MTVCVTCFHSTESRQDIKRENSVGPVFISCLCISLSLSPSFFLCFCPWKRKGQTQPAWEQRTTTRSEQRDIKGHPICTAAYAHPHVHKHRLTYLEGGWGGGLLSLKFITNGRAITLSDRMWSTRSKNFPKQLQLAKKVAILELAILLFLGCNIKSSDETIHRLSPKRKLCTVNSFYTSALLTADLS